MDTPTTPVKDPVAKVDNELAVGEDLGFQRRWWTFERWVWRFIGLIVIADLCGAFGRGPLANASKSTPDGTFSIQYERIERFSTPSILKIRLGPQAVHNGAIRLQVSTSLVTRLGNQRIIPEPARSTTVQDGVIYTFPSDRNTSLVSFALQPARIGTSHITFQLLSDGTLSQPPQDKLTLGIFVMP